MPTPVFPKPELFESASGEPSLRWGVMAPGGIAGSFVRALRRHTRQHLTAVGSRSLRRAELFASEHGFERAYSGYERVAEDPGVDVVYVAAPASEHLRLGLLAIHAGKHVLIEKPFATSSADAQTLVDEARTAGVFAMEAMWSRYLPQASVIRTLVEDGALGDIRAVHADHGQNIPADPNHRLNQPALGGGALLDLGIYPIQLDSMILGAPEAVIATGSMSSFGVDERVALVLDHGADAQSILSTTLLARTSNRATIAGTLGRIEIDAMFFAPTTLVLHRDDAPSEQHRWVDRTGVNAADGLSWQATALARYVGEGRTESPLHTLDETVSILSTIDAARRQVLHS